MAPAQVFALLAAIQAAIAAAPKVAEIVDNAKQLITSLFTAKLISKEQQDACHSYVDAQAALFATGIIPEALVVAPDPQ